MGSYQETKAYYDSTGTRTLWTNSMFGGMPTYQIAPASPNSLIGTIAIYNVLVSGWSLPKPMNAVFLYGLSFYLLLIAFRVRPWLALAGAIGYAFASFNIIIIEAGHMLQAYALATAPLVLAAAALTLRSRSMWLGAALFTLALAINLRTSHIQMTYYLAFVLVFYVLAEGVAAFRKKQLPRYLLIVALFGIGSLIAVGTTATLQMTTYEYGKESTRGKSELEHTSSAKTGGLDRDYAFDHSISPGEALMLMIPNARGGASGAIGNADPGALKNVRGEMQQSVAQYDAYWGGQSFVAGPAYMGAVICFLFVLGLFVVKGPDKWWMAAAALLSILLAMGKYFPSFNEFFLYNVPLYNKFRSVAFTLVIANMVLPLLAMLAAERILLFNIEPATARKAGKPTGPGASSAAKAAENKADAGAERQADFNQLQVRNLVLAFALTGGLCLILAMLPQLSGNFTKPNELAQFRQMAQGQIPAEQIDQAYNTIMPEVMTAREAMFKSDALRSFGFILVAAGLIFLYYRQKLNATAVALGLAILVGLDLYTLDKRYMNEKSFVNNSQFTADFVPTPADQAVLADPDPDYRVVNITKNVFNDATVSYFHKNIGGYHGAKLRRLQELNDHYLYNVVGILQQNYTKIPVPALLQQLNEARLMNPLNMLNTKYIIYGDQANQVARNPGAMGHAWFVKGWKIVDSATQEINMLGNLNLRDTAIVRNNFAAQLEGLAPSADTTGTIRLLSYRPDVLEYESNSPVDRLALFSEVYYDDGLGWHVYLDGQRAKHLRADWLIRGMRIPAGKHKITFRFEPDTFARGEQITLASSILLLLALLGGIFAEYRRRKAAGA